jgi:predicted metal-dependent hydrolase
MDASLTIIRRQVKHARLRVREDASVQLIVPHSFDQSLIDSLLQKKAEWIARHQLYFRDQVVEQRPIENNEIRLYGEVFRLVPSPELGHKVILDEAAKEIRTGRDLKDKNILAQWYRAHAADQLTQRIGELSVGHCLPFKRLLIRSQRTKWGSCSSNGNISLNWRLILTPRLVIDYVIMHELVHTKILDHTHSFWVHLRAAYPASDDARHWLRHHRNIGLLPEQTT